MDVSTKLTTDEINYCFDVLTDSMAALANPDASTKTKNTWYGEQVTIEISTGTYKDLNGSKNKTVALTFSMPEAAKAQATAKPTAEPTTKPTKKPSTKAKGMEVVASASCSDYNSVGNNWGYAFYINDKQVGANSPLSYHPGYPVAAQVDPSLYLRNYHRRVAVARVLICQRQTVRAIGIDMQFKWNLVFI